MIRSINVVLRDLALEDLTTVAVKADHGQRRSAILLA